MRKRFIARMEDGILEQTNLSRSIFARAASFYSGLPQIYHNYAHAVAFTAALLDMGKLARFPRGKLSVFALAGLYHDSGNTEAPLMTPLDEIRAAMNFYNDWHDRPDELRRIAQVASDADHTPLLKLGMGLIMATPMHVRGQIAVNSDHAMFADADFHFCAVTPCYWMYTCQGMRREWSVTKNDPSLEDPVKFWRHSNRAFIERYLLPNGRHGAFRSGFAFSAFHSDPRWVQQVIERLPDAAYYKAMELHDEDIERHEFEAEMMRIPGMPAEFGLTHEQFIQKARCK